MKMTFFIFFHRDNFRESLLKICRLRATFPEANIACLTATATQQTIDEVASRLEVDSFQTVSLLPDR